MDFCLEVQQMGTGLRSLQNILKAQLVVSFCFDTDKMNMMHAERVRARYRPATKSKGRFHYP